MGSVRALFALLLLVALPRDVQGKGFVCTGGLADDGMSLQEPVAKLAGQRHRGQRNALVLFATFADDATWSDVPEWGAQLLDPSLPGSLSHFYDTMSFGALRVRGESAPQVYRSRHAASHYLSADPVKEGRFGEFCLEVLEAADPEVDFSRFDNDGPDGIPSSGDDDGLVDVLFIVVPNAPANFLLGPATGIANLGTWSEYTTDDRGLQGQPTRVSASQGTIQQGAIFPEASGAMCHEFGHVLGLPDLYDTVYLLGPDAPPEEDSAGIGAWGLMGWGALGWGTTSGPNSLCAWSRQRLGWAQVLEPEGTEATVELEQVGASGQVCRIPLSGREYLLLEYRRRSSTYYDRGIPGEGLLVWHVGRAEYGGGSTPWWKVDLECADGRWADAGYPLGKKADAHGGGDNLDYWAHDAAYAARHGGNLGDATDPFDGATYRSFTPDTNPAATSRDREHAIHLEEITIEGDRLWAQVRMSPPVVKLTDVAPQAERVAAGGPVAITFHLANTGANPATGLRAELRTDDEVLQVLDPSLELSPLRPGYRSIGGNVSPQGFPRVLFPASLEREHAATVELVIYADGAPLARGTTVVTGVPAHRVVATVTDSGGRPLPGIRVSLAESWGVEREVFFDSRIKTDSAGVAELFAPTGTYTLSAEPAQKSPWGWVQRRDLRIDGDAEFELSLPRAYVLSGVVRDAHGTPVSSQYLVLERTTDGNRTSSSYWVDSDGTFSIKLATGEYAVSTRSYAGGASIPPQDHGRIDLHRDTVLDITLEEGLSLTVKVVDEDGADIDGVRVSVSPGGEAYSIQSSSSVTRDGEGATVEVMPGSYKLELGTVPVPYLPPGALSQVTVLGDTSVSVVLARGLSLTVQLVDESGEMVELPSGANAQVSLFAIDGGPSYWASLASGPAEFSIGVLPGEYQALLRAFSGLSEFLPSQDLGVAEVRSDTTVTFPVSFGVWVSGRICGEFGGVGTNNSVQLRSESGTYTSASLDADGTFAVRLVPDEYTVRVSFYSGELVAPSQGFGTVQVTQDTVFEWHLMEDEVVEGRVLDIHGEGIADLSIDATSSIDGTSVSNWATTRDDGTFAIRLPAARYSVRATRYLTWSQVTWSLYDLEVPPLEPPVYVLPGGAILTTMVIDAAGRPAPASVRLHPGRFSLREYMEATPVVDASLRSGRSYQLELAPGRYWAVVSPYGSSAGIYSRVVDEVMAEDESELVASLPSPGDTGLLTGTLTDVDGSAPAFATLCAYDPGLGLLATAWARDGRYEFPLPPGVYEMGVRIRSPDEGYTVHELGRIEVDGDRTWDIVLGDGTAVDDAHDAVPHRFALEQNYPNPFNAETVIRFSVGTEGRVEVTVYDLLGQSVRTVLSGWQAAGQHVVRWDGRDEGGHPVATGVYLYRLEAADRVAARKLLLLR